MSRGPKDLRDLICVSRLTFRQSDDEVVSEDDFIAKDWDEISLDSSESCDSQQGSMTKLGQKGQSPDSGCGTNGGSPQDSNLSQSRCDPELKLDLSGLHHKKKSKKKKKKKTLETELPKFPFPKPPPLPPVGRSESFEEEDLTHGHIMPHPPTESKPGHGSGTSIRRRTHSDASSEHKEAHSVSVSNDVDEESTPVRPKSQGGQTYRVQAATRVESGDYDSMLCYMDATVVSGWLGRANKSVSDVANYINVDDNFVQFAHFWLTDFPDTQKREIFELEIEILREELGFAFAPGRDDGKVSQRDISNLIGAIFREYPAKLVSARGNILFLDYLDVLTSARTEKYKKLLSDVKCSTKNKQYAQWLLATRSFALVSMWCAIVNFYRNLLGKTGTANGKGIPDVPSTFRSVYEKRLFQALRRGFTDVVHYLHIGEYVDLRMIDSHERTLIFTAVMHNQPKVLQYLVSRVKPTIDINHISDTGNTALHAAVNNGSAQLVAILLKSSDINVNCINSQCENAAPLHLAVLHGHKEITDLLLKAGANTFLKMGDLTPQDIAKEFDHPDIMELFQSS